MKRMALWTVCLASLASAAAGQTSFDTTASTGLRFATGAGSPTVRMQITQAGNVGVGITPTTALEVSGTVSSTQLYSNRALASLPIGVVLPWHKNLGGVPGLPDGWLECNGQTISDAQSPMNGQAVPDLNSQVYAGGRGYYIRGGTTSGNTNPSSYLSGNGSKYNFNYTGSAYYGINYGNFWYSENGTAMASFSTTSSNLGLPYMQVAAMTVVYIIKIK